jgi:hypothetical protein
MDPRQNEVISRLKGIYGRLSLSDGQKDRGEMACFFSRFQVQTVLPVKLSLRAQLHLRRFRHGLFFDLLFSDVRRLDPTDYALLGLNHEPIVATAALNHRDEDFAF